MINSLAQNKLEREGKSIPPFGTNTCINFVFALTLVISLVGVYQNDEIDTNEASMYSRLTSKSEPSPPLQPSASRSLKKQVRITKKIRTAKGVWQFISLQRVNSRYVWDKREGYYYIEWWEGRRRCRQPAGQTPTQATDTKRRKRNELIGEMATGGRQRLPLAHEDEAFTRIPDAVEFFTTHIQTHSPAKPRTLERYKEVISHFERLIGKKKYVEAISRLHIDDYKIARSKESVGKGKVTRKVTPSTINFEVTVLRSFF